MGKVIETTIEQLIPDNHNFNKGTQFGQHLIEKSIGDFGLGRSILIDKNDRIIAGNKTTENAVNAGFDKVIIVETTGNELVAVKRKDIDLDTPRGRELALADNATGKANLEWDKDAIMACAEQYSINPEDWGVSMDDDTPETPADDDAPKNYVAQLIVNSKDLTKLSMLCAELKDRGFDCSIKE